MRSKFIKQRELLPQEFSLKKYRALNSLDFDGWYQVVSARVNLDRRMRNANINLKNGCEYENDAIYLLEKPVPIDISPVQESDVGDFVSLPGESISEYGIRPVNFFTALSIGHDKERFGPEIEAFERYLRVDNFSPEDRDLLQQPICSRDAILFEGRSPDVTIDISLALPDQILIKEFELWLKSIRKELKLIHSEGQGKQSNVVSDVTLGLVKMSMAIPYIDLRLWAASVGFRISPELFTDVLEMDGVKRLENTKKWVKWLLNPRTVDALFGECASKAT